MTRSIKILRNAGIGAAVLVMVVVITLILVVRTDRFREYVRHKIITATEEGTGGRVEIGTFSFDWRHLRAVVTDFVVHGLEPADAAPYLRAGRVEIHIRLLTSFKHLLDIAYLGVDHPEANIMVLQDGSTNVPKPKQPSNSSSTPLETVVDLQVGQFQLSNGSVTFDSRKQDFNLRGDQLRVQLWFDTLKRGYKGEISLMPFYVVSGRNTPVRFSVTMPVTLERDRIVFQHGQIVTDASHLTIDGALENLREPKTSGHVWGHIALADLKNAANLAALANLNGAPPALDLDVNATMADNQIEIAASKISFGKSNIEASGKLQDPAGNGLLRFQANLALDELGRLERLDTRPEGMVHLTGTASMDAKQNYNVLGEVKASNVSFIGGTRRIGNVSLVSAAHVTPQRADLTGLRLRIFGGEIAGNASMEDFARYSVKADLRGLNLQTVSHEMGLANLAYSGTISGPLGVTGDLRAAGATGLAAQARFSIAPGAIGIPVSGRLNADYQGAADNLNVVDSYVALPHTRLTMNGSVGRKLDLTLTSRDLRDFAPALGGTVPVELAGGSASFQGSVSGRLAAPQITGHLAVVQFAVQGRQFDALGADVAASTSGAAVSGGTLRHGAMQTQFAGSVGLRNWSPTQNQPLALEASVHSGDLADMFALAGASPAGYSGALTADVHVAGTVANPRGSANFSVTNGSAQGQPFDNAQVQVQLADQLVTIPAAQITSGKSRVNLTAEFHHPRDHFDRGQVHAHIESGQVDLAALRAVQNREPNSSGTLHLTADVTGDLRDSGFQLTNVTGDATGRSLHIDGQNFGDFTLTARTNAQAVTYDASSDFAGSRIRVTGNTQLATGYRTTADADISGLPIERMLAIAHRTDIPAQGTLTAKAHFAGTTDHPEGTLDATVDRGVFYDEPIDRIHASGNYLATSIELSQLEIRAGASVLQASARYDHAANDLGSGNAQFRVTNGHLDLARLRNLQKMRPGITGAVQFTASGSGATRDASPRFLARDLNLNLAAKGLAAEGKSLGDLTLTADTSGSQVHFALDSNLANASIQGRGDGQLGGDYPVQAQVTFHNVSWKGLQPLLGPADPQWTNFDAATEGQIAINGPLLRTNELRSRLQLDKVQLTAAAEGTGNRPVTIDNQGPVVLSLDHGVVKIESLKLSGPQTDVQAQGSVSLDARTLEASLSAHTDLSLLRRFRRDIVSSGAIVADARVRGTFDKPLVDGKLDLQNVSFNVADVPTGMANANGTVQFNGNTATVRNLTGEVGGGKLTLSGFVTYVDAIRFGLRAKATKVRVRLQPGVSAIADADVRLSGIRNNSVLSGTVTIDQVTYAPESDFGAILSRAAPPVQSPTAPSPVLDNMKLDIQVRTSSATALQASVAQNLQADANLHIQGTAAQPGVLGRISITEGRLVFFSSSYTVDTGTISFYNPVRIEPVLDLSLATKAKGVDVVLRVTGPVDNMKLTYTSEPPLQFQEIVGLLAAGQTPTSDPTLLANQPTQPPQSFEQMGETALLSKALADPVSNRLQRVFGVTQLKIDPTFSGNADLPQAQLTLQQQVTSRVTLTYSTALDNPNAQVLRGEFALNRQWSATATRDQYGIFSIKFQYKTQIR